MDHVFSTISDIRRYASEQLASYDHDQYGCDTQDDLVALLVNAIRTAPGFAYGEDMSDLLDLLHDEQEGWTPALDGESNDNNEAGDWTIYEDNAGGLHLYHRSNGNLDYLHRYDDAAQIADDIEALCNGDNPASDWDGNEIGERVEDMIAHPDHYSDLDIDEDASDDEQRETAIEWLADEMDGYVREGNGGATVILTGVGVEINANSVIADPSGSACRSMYAFLVERGIIDWEYRDN